MFSILLESAARAMLLAGAIAAILKLMRMKPPALRHRVWTCVVVTMLLLPVLLALELRTTVSVLPVEAWQSAALARTAVLSGSAVQSLPYFEPAVKTPSDWKEVALFAYCAGLSVFLVRLAIGTV